MELPLIGKGTIVTGAGSGIGRGIALAFAAEGARVAVVDINEETGTGAAAEIRARGGEGTFIRADVSRAADVARMVEDWPEAWPLDVLCNNAGIGLWKRITETTEEEWDRVIDTNLKSVFLCCREVIPIMQRRRRGSIINIGSVHAFATAARYGAYSASKGGIAALTRSLAVDYAGDGIRANCICPGFIETPVLEQALRDEPDPEATRRAWNLLQPIGRLGTPEEVAGLAVYLASDHSSFVTGSALLIDGGMLARAFQ